MNNFLKLFFLLIYNISLLNFTTEELINVSRLRIVDGYGNISRQQLENIFIASWASFQILIPMSKPDPRPAIRISTIPTPRTRRTREPLPIDVDELEKNEYLKNLTNTRKYLESMAWLVNQAYSRILRKNL